MPFVKGQSGNKNGRGSDKPWRDALMLAINEVGPDKQKKLRAIAQKLVERAMDGEVPALKEIGDRLDGKPGQQIALTGVDEGPIQVVIKGADTGLL
jgi:hypothetical protein